MVELEGGGSTINGGFPVVLFSFLNLHQRNVNRTIKYILLYIYTHTSISSKECGQHYENKKYSPFSQRNVNWSTKYVLFSIHFKYKLKGVGPVDNRPSID